MTVFVDLQDGREIGRIHDAESIVATEGTLAATLNVDLVPVVRVWHTRAN